jgi:broad specificity phosphatase PhoE
VKLLLVRHGETDHNSDDLISGQVDVKLNETGVRQAKRLANRMDDWDIDSCYSSDLKRTYKTVGRVAERHGLDIRISKDLRERAFGEFEGRPKDDWRQKVRNSDQERIKISSEKGESLNEVGERLVNQLERISRENKQDEAVLVGSHSVAIKAAILRVFDLKGRYYGKLEQGNAALTILRYERGEFVLDTMNDTSHLE